MKSLRCRCDAKPLIHPSLTGSRAGHCHIWSPQLTYIGWSCRSRMFWFFAVLRFLMSLNCYFQVRGSSVKQTLGRNSLAQGIFVCAWGSHLLFSLACGWPWICARSSGGGSASCSFGKLPESSSCWLTYLSYISALEASGFWCRLLKSSRKSCFFFCPKFCGCRTGRN